MIEKTSELPDCMPSAMAYGKGYHIDTEENSKGLIGLWDSVILGLESDSTEKRLYEETCKG